MDRAELRLLLQLSEEIERVSDIGEKVKDSLQDPGHRTPEDSTLGGIVSHLGKAKELTFSLVSKFPEEVVQEEIHRGGYFVSFRKDEK